MKLAKFDKTLILIGILVLSLILSVNVQAYIERQIQAALTFQTTIQEGSLTSSASYIIFKDGSTYYARNGLSGIITFSGSVFSTVINNAINSLGSAGGKILIKQGIYYVTQTIILKQKVILQGEGVIATDLWLSANVDMIKHAPTTTEQFSGIYDMRLYGDKAIRTSGNGIVLSTENGGTIWDFQCSHVWVTNFPDSGLKTECLWGHRYIAFYSEANGEFGAYIYNEVVQPDSGYFDGCRFSDNGYDGIYGNFRRCTFVDTEVDHNGMNGIKLEGATENSFIGGYVMQNSQTSPNSYDGIVVNGAQNRIVNMELNGINKERYGVNIGWYADTIVTGCHFSNHVTNEIYFLGNPTYILYNSNLTLDVVPFAYTVFKEDDAYYARDGSGSIRVFSANFSYVMITIINELYGAGFGKGGSIKLCAGAYFADTTIAMKAGIHIFGEGRVGNDDFTVLCTSIFATADISVFTFDFVSAGYHSGLHNFLIDGLFNSATHAIIDVTCSNGNTADLFFEDLSIGRGKYGIRVSNSHASNRIWNVFIERCFIEACNYSAVLFESSTDESIFQCRILGNHFYGNNLNGGTGALEISGDNTRGGVISDNTFELEKRNAIYLSDGADSWTISDNIIIDASQSASNTYSGIKLVDVDYISVTGNIAVNRDTNYMKYGFEADDSCTYITKFGNIFSGQTADFKDGLGEGNKADTPNESYSYLVFTDGTNYYAKNGVTGQIDFSGGVFSTVFQAVIDSSADVSIFLKNAVYDVSSMAGASYLNIGNGKNVILIGEDAEKTVIKDDRDVTDFGKTISGGTDFTSNVTVKNIKFDRSVPDSTSIHKYVFYGFKWNRFWVENCKFVGNNTLANDSVNKHVLGAICTGTSSGAKEVYMLRNTVIDFQYGFVFHPATNLRYALFDKNYLENSETWTLGTGYDIPAGAQVLITDNICVDCGWADEGISIDRTHEADGIVTIAGLVDDNLFMNSASKTGRCIAIISVSGVTVSNNRIYDLGTNKWGNRIFVNSNNQKMTDIVVRDNDIFAAGYGNGIVFDGGVQSGQILNNRIWMEGTGSTTGTAVRCIQFNYEQSIAYDSGGKITVKGNYLAAVGSGSYRYGVDVLKSAGSGGTVDVFIVDNTIYKCQRAFISTLPDTVLTMTIGRNVRDTIGTTDHNYGAYSMLYLENSINFSSISNGTYVAHGCAGTPDYVTITLSVQGYAWYGTLNSTHCRLYFSVATASGTVRFEYVP